MDLKNNEAEELIDKYLQGDADVIDKFSYETIHVYTEIYDKIQIHADNGNKYAQSLLGCLWLKKWHNIDEALKWLKLSVEQGVVNAQYNIGIIYSLYLYEYKEAIKWWKLAADKNDKKAQNMLGWCYEMGKGIAQDDGKALEYYRLSASQNYDNGLYNLASAYYKGIGTKKDYSQAYKYGNLAQGFSPADFLCRDLLGEKSISQQIILTLLVRVNKAMRQIQQMEQFIEHLSLYPGSNLKDAEHDFGLLVQVKKLNN